MNANQQFWLQVISEIFAGLTPLLLGAFGLWLRQRMNKQDADRALKTDQTLTAVQDCKTKVLDKVGDTGSQSAITVNVGGSNDATPPATVDRPAS